jgi:hypothetical protein
MPTKTRSKSKSPNNNALLKAMAEGKILWGDLIVSNNKKHKTRKSKSPARAISPNYEAEMLEDFRVPDLRLRKGIYDNFPVIVNEVRPGVYEIKWHMKKLKEWRGVKPETWDEYQEYEAFTEFRLLHSLRKYNSIYELLPAEHEGQIVLFRMKEAINTPRYNGPRLMRLNDINKYFPNMVIWNKVDGRIGESTYSIKIRDDFVRRVGPKNIVRAEHDLMEALRNSPAWLVLNGDKGELCRIEMKHEK